MKNKLKWIRQGDVILQQVDNIPKGEEINETILAYGEVTGHKHLLKGKLLLAETTKGKFVECQEDCELVHEEHNTLKIPKGKYQVMIQREVDLLGEVRSVMD